ncbi:MAG: 50S ribosomal protein L13 [Candidatus Moranbacteria bacterium GW2011_GWC2_37_8]|nr:MAG: 50S ribosomal protein L13 [Candidatus Moranbacteria bacterium GW2011_GWC2_37_8]KKQ62913.1 MAG: 50S ribosomal subunit protein L13, large subunit ribosomal protein L13 [Parcubacteria group bacterium GW2011_GWC1_38_22]KKQ81240.1 MAG: 50S ribosomal protein L13 [Candidatus Moranbacteria bacterium GW2011_GWD2_38_7]
MNRHYHLFDAQGKVLGRLATEIAKTLSGRNKVDYVPHIDGGDFVIVINMEKIHVTGNKLEGKIYHKYSGYPGGISAIALKDLLKKDAGKVMQNAVYGMLPKNKLRDKMMLRLHVFGGSEHSFKNIEFTH